MRFLILISISQFTLSFSFSIRIQPNQTITHVDYVVIVVGNGPVRRPNQIKPNVLGELWYFASLAMPPPPSHSHAVCHSVTFRLNLNCLA